MDKVRAGEIEQYVPHPSIANAAIPDAFDSATNWPQCESTINDIRDQSNCGCCWAFAGAEAASDRMCISSNATLLMPLAAEDVCFNPFLTGGCNGGQISTPWSFIKNRGAVTGGNYTAPAPWAVAGARRSRCPTATTTVRRALTRTLRRGRRAAHTSTPHAGPASAMPTRSRSTRTSRPTR